MIPESVSGRWKRRRREGEKTQEYGSKYELHNTWVSEWDKEEMKEGGIERLRFRGTLAVKISGTMNKCK